MTLNGTPTTDIFIAYTPYQILTHHSIATGLDDCEQHLYIIPAFDTNEAARLKRLIAATDSFDTVSIRPGKFKGDRKRPRKDLRNTIYENICFFQDLSKVRDIRTVYASVDTKEVVQAAMEVSPRNVYVEDGAQAYCSATTGWKSYPHWLLNKLIYLVRCGFLWESVSIYGTSSHIDEVRAVYPSQLRSELQRYPLRKIDPEPIRALSDTEEYSLYLSEYNISKDDLRRLEGVIMLPHSSVVSRNPEYKEIIENILHRCSKSDCDIALKYHPRDTNTSAILASESSQYSELPPAIPLELLYLAFESRLDFIIGNTSTGVYTAKWLCENTEVFSLARLLEQLDEAIIEAFSNIGVRMISDPSQIETLLA